MLLEISICYLRYIPAICVILLTGQQLPLPVAVKKYSFGTFGTVTKVLVTNLLQTRCHCEGFAKDPHRVYDWALFLHTKVQRVYDKCPQVLRRVSEIVCHLISVREVQKVYKLYCDV